MSSLTDEVKNSIKNVVKTTAKMLLPWILIIVSIFILLGCFMYIIDKNAFDKGGYSAKSYLSATKINDGTVEINKESIIDNALAEKGYTDEEIRKMTLKDKQSKLGISELNLDETSASELMWNLYEDTYSQYLDSAEELAKLMNAELITQYVDTRENPNEEIDWSNIDLTSDKIQGIVKIKRKTNNAESTLIYKSQSDFESLVNSNNDDALKYFSLDDQNNLLIATYQTENNKVTTNDDFDITAYSDIEYTKSSSGGNTVYENKKKTLSITKVNYQALIPDKYKMPFSYLWGLLIYSGDKDFALELADLVMDSDIEITIHDNIATTTKEDIYQYRKQTRTDTYTLINIENNQDVVYQRTCLWWGTEKVNNYPSGVWPSTVNVLKKVTSPSISGEGSRNNSI